MPRPSKRTSPPKSKRPASAPRSRAGTRRSSEPFAKRRWQRRTPPPFCVTRHDLKGQPNRLLVDVEANPPLTDFEADHLLNVVVGYLELTGRSCGLVSGYEREEHAKDFATFAVVRRGET